MRGDILLVDFSPAQAGEANFVRPAIVVTNDMANEYSPVLIVVPITSNLDRLYPFELALPAEHTGLDRDSKAQVQLIRHVGKARVRKTISHLPADLMIELENRLRVHLGL